MELTGWEERYRAATGPREDRDAPPTPLLLEAVRTLSPGAALDLACGTGRNAIWLAERGWKVTAVDGAAAAVAVVCERASHEQLSIDARVADLSTHEFLIQPAAWDLIAICYYLQRDLFEPAKHGVRPGGVLLAIVHITEGDEQPTPHRLLPGELAGYFRGWDILHHYEGKPADPAHRRAVAEVIARKPF